ncbi:unnamed protein product [Vitrella brassicaformis CCMP3155]|uniref:Uncharacterized protein n=1 Tax=Vitrella brassicaformis (strain CCMP3155) TaxID=1169540 RepID=A0A0G4GZF4_VITBC|nr:unnamed protein product [Vitrella brassicaformis CCMP3155]|eukprot:CEM36587.1 unnamed protein product [Vitrella brassicaformis CCMP3155]
MASLKLLLPLLSFAACGTGDDRPLGPSFLLQSSRDNATQPFSFDDVDALMEVNDPFSPSFPVPFTNMGISGGGDTAGEWTLTELYNGLQPPFSEKGRGACEHVRRRRVYRRNGHNCDRRILFFDQVKELFFERWDVRGIVRKHVNRYILETAKKQDTIVQGATRAFLLKRVATGIQTYVDSHICDIIPFLVGRHPVVRLLIRQAAKIPKEIAKDVLAWYSETITKTATQLGSIMSVTSAQVCKKDTDIIPLDQGPKCLNDNDKLSASWSLGVFGTIREARCCSAPGNMNFMTKKGELKRAADYLKPSLQHKDMSYFDCSFFEEFHREKTGEIRKCWSPSDPISDILSLNPSSAVDYKCKCVDRKTFEAAEAAGQQAAYDNITSGSSPDIVEFAFHWLVSGLISSYLVETSGSKHKDAVEYAQYYPANKNMACSAVLVSKKVMLTDTALEVLKTIGLSARMHFFLKDSKAAIAKVMERVTMPALPPFVKKPRKLHYVEAAALVWMAWALVLLKSSLLVAHKAQSLIGVLAAPDFWDPFIRERVKGTLNKWLRRYGYFQKEDFVKEHEYVVGILSKIKWTSLLTGVAVADLIKAISSLRGAFKQMGHSEQCEYPEVGID